MCCRTNEQVLMPAQHNTSLGAAGGAIKRGQQEAHLAQREPGLPVPLEDWEPAEQHADEQQQKVELQQGKAEGCSQKIVIMQQGRCRSDSAAVPLPHRRTRLCAATSTSC